jgi:hypothetical protein
MWKDSLIVVEVVRVMAAVLVILVSVVVVVVIVRNFWVFVGVVLVFTPTCNNKEGLFSKTNKSCFVRRKYLIHRFLTFFVSNFKFALC